MADISVFVPSDKKALYRQGDIGVFGLPLVCCQEDEKTDIERVVAIPSRRTAAPAQAEVFEGPIRLRFL
jgi:hypothetical protein